MRYLCSQNATWRKGLGDVCLWKEAEFVETFWNRESDSFEKRVVKYSDPEEFMKRFYQENLRPLDFDTCGEEKVYFVFSNGKSYLLEHFWWYETVYDDEDDEEGSYGPYGHECNIKAFDVANMPDMMKIKDRDWL